MLWTLVICLSNPFLSSTLWAAFAFMLFFLLIHFEPSGTLMMHCLPFKFSFGFFPNHLYRFWVAFHSTLRFEESIFSIIHKWLVLKHFYLHPPDTTFHIRVVFPHEVTIGYAVVTQVG